MDRIPRIGTCSIDGCDKPVKARGWCAAHYKAWEKYGDPLVNKARRAVITPCGVTGCGKAAQTRGLCPPHYKALLRHGDPTIRKNNSVRKPCAAEGCENLTTRTYCNAHETRQRRYGDANFRPPKVGDSACRVEGCGEAAAVGDLCMSHHRRKLRHGDHLGGRPALSKAQIEFIQANRGKMPPLELADQVGTTGRTVIAVQAGRNWGWLRE